MGEKRNAIFFKSALLLVLLLGLLDPRPFLGSALSDLKRWFKSIPEKSQLTRHTSLKLLIYHMHSMPWGHMEAFGEKMLANDTDSSH